MSEFTNDLKNEASELTAESEEILHDGAEKAETAIEKAQSCVTSNPVPYIAGALALGIVIGLLVPREKPAATSLLEGRLDELKELLGSLKSRVSSKAEGGYSEVSSALGDALQKAKKRFHLS